MVDNFLFIEIINDCVTSVSNFFFFKAWDYSHIIKCKSRGCDSFLIPKRVTKQITTNITSQKDKKKVVTRRTVDQTDQS